MQLTRRDILLATAAAAVLRSAPVRAGAPSPADAAAERLLSEIAEELLRDNPEGATALGIDTGARAALKSKLTDKSPAGQARIAAHLDTRLKQLAALDMETLGKTARIDVDVVRTAFELGRDGFRFPFGDVAVGSYRNGPYVVAQNMGAYLDAPRFLDSSHTLESPADAEAYLARMEAFADQLDGETERLRHDGAMGVIAPDFLLDKTLRAMAMTHQGPPESWGVVASLASRTRTMPGNFAARAAGIAANRIGPALLRQEAELKAHRARATGDAGVWKLPEGEAYYAWALRAGTTTDLTPDEVHRMGREQLADLQSQMDAILRTIGYSRGSVGQRMTALGKDPKYLFPDNDEGRRQIMAFLTDRLNAMRAKMPQAFHTLVPGNVEVKRLPPAEEPGAPGAYGGAGTIDGKVPGRLWINLRTTAIWPRYALPTLAYHEAIPGHAWQGEYTFKLPLIRSLLAFNAYSEGWALYSEQLADELGAYADSPVDRLGYLQSLAFRACRLVVDTGLHAKRWTRDQAIRWFATTNGSTVEEVQGEVDRYCAWPGQACGYKVGHSEIVRLREDARKQLGDRFDFRAFNDVVVTGGGVPLTVLGRSVANYVASARR